MKDIIEKIKRKAHAFKLAKLSQTGNLSEFLKDNLVIPLDDVLKILDVEHEKLQELADLLKNRPNNHRHYSKAERCFQSLERKLGEML